VAAKTTSELPVANGLTANDRLVVLGNTAGTSNTYTITVQNLFANAGANVVLQTIATPANSTATTVRQGTVLWDSSYIYVATANNTLKRVALSTF
jgi:hypothetical protein